MKLYTGTSGYGYKEWKGKFYPEKLAADGMLRFYAGRLGSVEINNTFYRMPTLNTAEAWAEQVPRGFRFSVKAPQVITHVRRLRNAGEETRAFLKALGGLGTKFGAALFQFPPSFREDRGLLRAYAERLPAGAACAFEFRHPSWLNQGTYDLLGEKGFALCNADTDEDPAKGIIATAPWGYLRLRRAEYPEAALARWTKLILAQKWKRAFVYFKHEGDEAVKGPEYAERLAALARGEA